MEIYLFVKTEKEEITPEELIRALENETRHVTDISFIYNGTKFDLTV